MGDRAASREFLYVEDAAQAIVVAAEHYNGSEPVNVGGGVEITIRDLVEMIRGLVRFEGEVRWDANRPDGQPRRMLDTTRAQKEFGFLAQTDLEDGLATTIEGWKSGLGDSPSGSGSLS